MIRSTQALTFTLFSFICFPLFEARAQAGGESTYESPIIPTHTVWLLEQPYVESPLLTARTYGDSAYGEHQVKATLKISCHPQSPTANFALQIAPQSLGFDSGPFEGKDASAHGPLRIITGARTGVDHLVNGIWAHGGVFQVGTIFALSTPIPHDELAYWASDASRGQSLELSLEPAEVGGKRLTATFSLPQNNEGLKKVIQPCLSAVAIKP